MAKQSYCPIPRSKDHLTQRRNWFIRKRFNELYEKEGVRMDKALEQLSLDEFFLSAETIQQIIKYQGRYRDDFKFNLL